MAYKHKTITNPVAGQTITFLQTAADTRGQLLEMQAVYDPGSREPPLHYHPSQAEDFIIESGEMHVKMNGVTRVPQTAFPTFSVCQNRLSRSRKSFFRCFHQLHIWLVINRSTKNTPIKISSKSSLNSLTYN